MLIKKDSQQSNENPYCLLLIILIVVDRPTHLYVYLFTLQR